MNKRFIRRLVVAFFVALTGGQGYQSYLNGVPVGEEISGVVLHVADGDTMRLNGIKIRVWGVDAPEADQRGYKEAAHVLEGQALLKKVTCTIHARDKYNRIVAQCFRDKSNIGAEVIKSGWARDYHRYSKGFYLKEEIQARQDRKGLWGKSS